MNEHPGKFPIPILGWIYVRIGVRFYGLLEAPKEDFLAVKKFDSICKKFKQWNQPSNNAS